jgi:hypothetical protein
MVTKMLQMSMKSGDEEQVLDLTDVPEFVLAQFCDLILRKQDLRNPDVRKMLRETVDALKSKAEKEPVDPVACERNSLKEGIADIEDLLKQFDTVTLRDRDSMGQIRLPIGGLREYIEEKMRF